MRQEVSILSAVSGFSLEMTDFMTLLHGRNDVPDDAVDNRRQCDKRRKRSGPLKQGLENPPSEGGVMRQEARFFLRGAVSVLK